MALKTAAAKSSTKAVPKTKAVKAAPAAAKPAGKAKTVAAPKPKAPPVVTLKHLAASMAGQYEMPQKQTTLLLTGLVDLIVDHLKQGDRLRIGGLGVLEVKNRPARMGRNPATGEAIQIKASKKIAFRAAKELKDAV
jgi:DNA-binding protein HU-beta